MEDGAYRYREPPRVTWSMEYGDGRPPNVIIGAKGLVPVLTVSSSDQPNQIIPDIVEIGGIEDLRRKKLLYDSISLACTHADFQGKRIVALLMKEGTLTNIELQRIRDLCRKFRCKPKRIGKWTFACVIEVLFGLGIISKDEHDTLSKLRWIRNPTQHQITAKYTLDPKRADEILQLTIQVLLRLRELPAALSTTISGYEWKRFWSDLGFGSAKS